MPFNGTKITTYKDGRDPANGTRALGTTFNNEFDRLYGNDNDLDSRVQSLQQAITDMIGGAPAALDTLNELAAALGDDENFSANVINRINAASEKNLVYNGAFRWFNNKSGIANWYDYKHPDGWTFADNGSDGKIGWNGTDEYCKIITSSDGSSMSFKQALHEFPRWQTRLKAKKVTVKIHIKGPSTTIVKLYDGVNTVQQALAGTGSIEIIQLQLTIDASATGLVLEIVETNHTQTIEIQKAYCNIGDYAIETLPCIIEGRIGFWTGLDEAYPIDVFEGDTTEIPAGYTRLESWLNKRFGTGAGGRSKLPEFQGRFMRVLANGNANDPDRASRTNRGDGVTGDKPGTKQDHQYYSHSHGITRGSASNYPGHDNVMGPAINAYTTSYTGAAGGNETRGININVLAGIKWS